MRSSDSITPFTSDRELFLERLSVQRAYGQTALFDAVAAAPGLVDEEIKGRKAIVLFTDGLDNASQLNVFDASQMARSVNVPIYSIGFSSLPKKLMPKGHEVTVLRVLELLSTETGGWLFTIHDEDDMSETVEQIGNELRHTYMIGYYSERGQTTMVLNPPALEPGKYYVRVRTDNARSKDRPYTLTIAFD